MSSDTSAKNKALSTFLNKNLNDLKSKFSNLIKINN